ncbi:MAG TPA: glycosyltransferase family 2 protein [Gemmataceae bacterium]
MSRPLLSVIVPVFNEEATIDAVLARLRDGPYPDKQVIVVDDGSTDGTPERLRAWENQGGWLFLRHERNRGKGAAVRSALEHAAGEITTFQDADLEYDPADLPSLIEPIRSGKATVVYGSRYLRDRGLRWNRFRLAVQLLNGVVRVLYGQRLTDEATCYKAMRTDLLRSLGLRADRFDLCPEITAKLCRLRIPIQEVPISYRPRGTEAGKKINWFDGVQALYTLLRWRVSPLPPTAAARKRTVASRR